MKHEVLHVKAFSMVSAFYFDKKKIQQYANYAQKEVRNIINLHLRGINQFQSHARFLLLTRTSRDTTTNEALR